MTLGHEPSPPRADGASVCSCGSAAYSPAAMVRHLAGMPMVDAEHGVYTAGPSDPWARQFDKAQAERAEAAAAAEYRSEMVRRYYDKARRRTTVAIAHGVGRSLTD